MRRPVIQSRNIIWLLLIGTIVFLLLLFAGRTMYAQTPLSSVAVLNSHSEDAAIMLSWDGFSQGTDTHLVLEIISEDTCETVHLDRNSTGYIFTQGIHGKRYDFSLKSVDIQGNELVERQVCGMFLNWAELPDMPLINIETRNNEKPTNDNISAPPGYLGITSINNSYVNAQLTLTENGETLVTDTVEIRVRGNTSSIGEKKPYKLRLGHPVDLLNPAGGKNQAKEWVLLSEGTMLNTLVGRTVAELCSAQWQPECELVNLMMNGDWLGCYWLVETIEAGANKVNIDKDGFIFESDAYWWNEEVFIKTPYTPEKMGYTFRYPTPESIPSKVLDILENYIAQYEQSLATKGDEYCAYINTDSYANWLLTHDILGSKDGGGTNFFLYIKSLNTDDPSALKINVGPAWDFDGAFCRTEQWSSVRDRLEFQRLTRNNAFMEIYWENWRDIRQTVHPYVQDCLAENIERNADAIQKSWDLDASRWQHDSISIQDALNATDEWLVHRIKWLNAMMDNA